MPLHLLPSFRPFPTRSGTVRNFYRTFTHDLVQRRGETPSVHLMVVHDLILSSDDQCTGLEGHPSRTLPKYQHP